MKYSFLGFYLNRGFTLVEIFFFYFISFLVKKNNRRYIDVTIELFIINVLFDFALNSRFCKINYLKILVRRDNNLFMLYNL